MKDLSKASDCIPHDRLIAKLHTYRIDENALEFLHSHLKRTKQCVKINNIKSLFEIILSRVPKWSALGPLTLTIFLNDLFLFITKSGYTILLMKTLYLLFVKT